MQKIKVGLVGAGFVGPAHVEAVRRLGYVEVAALAGRSPSRARSQADALHIPIAYGDYRELLADPEISVIHNCTPNYLHHEINAAALRAGKHVISEKPLAMTAQEARDLVRIAEETGLVNAVNFNYRYYPIPQEMRAMISAGKLGRVRLVHGVYLQDWLFYETDYNWRLLPEQAGASRAVADIGSHWCDLAQHLVGSCITHVFAQLETIIPVRKRPKGEVATFAGPQADAWTEIRINTEDYATVLIRFENGAVGTFTVSQISAGRKNRLYIEIDGSEASVAWNQEKPNELWIGYRDRPNEVLLRDPSLLSEAARPYAHLPGGHNEAWADGLKNMMINIYSFIRQGKDPRKDVPGFPTFRDGLVENLIVDAILESNRSGKWVEVERP